MSIKSTKNIKYIYLIIIIVLFIVLFEIVSFLIGLNIDTIRKIQGYGYFGLTVMLVFVLYGYGIHLYRSEKSGRRNYEKYSNLALNDEIEEEPVEAMPLSKDLSKKEKK